MKVNNCFCKTKKKTTLHAQKQKSPQAREKERKNKNHKGKKQKAPRKTLDTSYTGFLFVSSLPKKEKMSFLNK